MKAARDRNKLCVAVLTDLTKAFDCLNHDFLIEKYMLSVLITNFLELCTHILIIGFNSQMLKAQY